VVLACGVLAWPLRDLVPTTPPATPEKIQFAAQCAPALLCLWLGFLALTGAYSRRRFGAGVEEFQSVAKGSLVAAATASTACFFGDIPLSRGFLAAMCLLVPPLLIAERYAVRRWLHRRRAEGGLTRRVLAIGSRKAVADLARALQRQAHLGYTIVGCTVTDAGHPSPIDLPAPVVGSVEDLTGTCRRLDVDTVMVAGGAADIDLRDMAWDLEGRDIDLIVVPQLVDVSGPRLHMRPVGGLPLLHVEEPKAGRAAAWPKRLFDLTMASAGLVLATPVMIALAVLIRFEDRGPVFYRQIRIGLDGKPFQVWKFRSMRVGADLVDAQLRRDHGHSVGLFKLRHDPRVTRVGATIRRYSLDELPQLLNVIDGSMSLVGPRPNLPVEVDTYTSQARRRLSVRPGMTGLWQVSGRSNLSWDDAIRLDLYYRDNWSMVGDFAIIAKTVQAVLRKEGAY